MNWALDFAAVDVARLEVRESTLLSKKMEALRASELAWLQKASDVFFIGRCLFFHPHFATGVPLEKRMPAWVPLPTVPGLHGIQKDLERL
jgi:hypothetical protein